MRCADAGYRGHQVGAYGGHVTDGRAAMAVAEQIDFAAATDGCDLFHLLKQLFATGFGGVQLADFSDVDLGAVAAQGGRDAVPVIDAQQVVEAEHAVGQHDGVLGLRVAGGGRGLGGHGQAGGDSQCEQGFIVVHGCSHHWVRRFRAVLAR